MCPHGKISATMNTLIASFRLVFTAVGGYWPMRVCPTVDIARNGRPSGRRVSIMLINPPTRKMICNRLGKTRKLPKSIRSIETVPFRGLNPPTPNRYCYFFPQGWLSLFSLYGTILFLEWAKPWGFRRHFIVHPTAQTGETGRAAQFLCPKYGLGNESCGYSSR